MVENPAGFLLFILVVYLVGIWVSSAILGYKKYPEKLTFDDWMFDCLLWPLGFADIIICTLVDFCNALWIRFPRNIRWHNRSLRLIGMTCFAITLPFRPYAVGRGLRKILNKRGVEK